MNLTKKDILTFLSNLENHTHTIYMSATSGSKEELSACIIRNAAHWLYEQVDESELGNEKLTDIPRILKT